MKSIAEDLVAEGDALWAIASQADAAAFAAATPAKGWSVRDSLAHLAFFDTMALLTVQDSETFVDHRSRVLQDIEGYMEKHLEAFEIFEPETLVRRWWGGLLALAAAFEAQSAETRVEWYGPSMSMRGHCRARLMETWAHGQDIVDALGASREPTDRLEHVAQLGVSTFAWSFVVRGESVPSGSVEVALELPSGRFLNYLAGKGEVAGSVSGSALDFSLVVTQRRHVLDTHLKAEGSLASDWIGKAQAFAGGAGGGRAPGEFTDVATKP